MRLIVVVIRRKRRSLIQASFFQISIRLSAVIAYVVITAATVVHAPDHEVDVPYDNVCALCHFADQIPPFKPLSTILILPENGPVTWAVVLQGLDRIFIDSIGAIRAPPQSVTPLNIPTKAIF